MKLEFFEKENKMWFRCEIPDSNNPKDKVYSFSDEIPSFAVNRGKTAIRKYAKQEARKHIKKKREIDKIGTYLGRSHFYPLSVNHADVALKGIMFSDDGQYLEVHLKSPCRGEGKVRYGMFSAMSKKFIHGDIFGFSENAIGTSKELLIEIYQVKQHEKSEHGRIIELSEELNKKKQFFRHVDCRKKERRSNMKVRVSLPSFLKNPGRANEFDLELEQEDVKLIDVLLELEKLFPDAKGRIVPDGKPNKFINYSINNEDARFLQSGATPLKDGDSVTLLSAIAGG